MSTRRSVDSQQALHRARRLGRLASSRPTANKVKRTRQQGCIPDRKRANKLSQIHTHATHPHSNKTYKHARYGTLLPHKEHASKTRLLALLFSQATKTSKRPSRTCRFRFDETKTPFFSCSSPVRLNTPPPPVSWSPPPHPARSKGWLVLTLGRSTERSNAARHYTPASHPPSRKNTTRSWQKARTAGEGDDLLQALRRRAEKRVSFLQLSLHGYGTRHRK